MSRVLLLSALILMACGRMPRSSSAADSPKDESESSETSTSKESGDSSKSEDSEDSSPTKVPAGPSCLNSQGEVQECMSDKDCCPNFYCGIDPDGSTRIKTCLFGGN